MNTHHVIGMIPASADARTYGIASKSGYVYRTSRSSAPTRVVLWDNTGRGQGNGKYLDPNNNVTTDVYTLLLSTEATYIDNYGTGTGTPGSGQVWAPDVIIRPGDTVTVVANDDEGTNLGTFTAVFTNNGHGYLKGTQDNA